MTRIVINHGTLITGDAAQPVLAGGGLEIVDGAIASVSPTPADTGGADEVIDATGTLVTPGFVNAHTHLCMVFGRTLGSDRSLLSWLAESQIPLMQALEPQDYRLAMELGALENLKAGNTTVCEVFFSSHYADGADQIAAQGLDGSGIRATLFRCSNDESFFEGFVEDRADVVRRSEELIRQWEGHDRINVGVGPLVPWGSSAESFRDAVELSERHGVRIHLHTAETPEYNDLVRERTGKSNVGMLHDVGALGERVMLNHCVHLSDDDIGLIAHSGSHVIHDPTSNMILASGVAPVPKLRAAGVNVGLACDGPACNNAQDMIECMKYAALLQKVVSRELEVLVAGEVFRMATHGGAQALGMGDRLGVLAEGYLADVVVIDATGPHMTPIHDPMAALVYSARGADVRTVLVGGSVVVRDGEVQTLDEEATLHHARERAARAHSRAG